jgi:hypothetical protein
MAAAQELHGSAGQVHLTEVSFHWEAGLDSCCTKNEISHMRMHGTVFANVSVSTFEC